MIRHATRSRRRGSARWGASLIELLAALTASSVVMATAVGLVHRSYALECRSRRTISGERTALRLARAFRADVHGGGTARCAVAPDATWLVEIEGTSVRVTYAATVHGLERVAQPVDGAPMRELYPFPQGTSWRASRDGRIVSLLAIPPATGAGGPPIVVEVVATLGPDAIAAGGETP